MISRSINAKEFISRIMCLGISDNVLISKC